MAYGNARSLKTNIELLSSKHTKKAEGIGAYEMKLKTEKERITYERVVGYLVDFESDNRTLEQVFQMRSSRPRNEIVREVIEFVDSGLYREVFGKIMSYDGMFAFKMKQKYKNGFKQKYLNGEKIALQLKNLNIDEIAL